MKSFRNNLVVGVILSLMLSSTAFANPLANMIGGHLKDSLRLIDTFNKSAEDVDSLIARLQDATDVKNETAYSELRSLFDALNQQYKENSATLAKMQSLRDSSCALALADTSKSAESQNAIDACNELRDALGAASDSRGVTASGLDSANNAMSKYVVVLEALDAAVAKVNQERDLAAAKAQLEAERVAAELKAKLEAEAAAKQDAAARAAAAKAATLKKITITCVKGKLTKKVTAVKPVCPAGYKKK